MEAILYPSLVSGTMSEFVAFYNEHSNLKPVKKFSTKDKAQKAVSAIIARLEGDTDPELEEIVAEAQEDATSLLSQLTAVGQTGQKSSTKNEGVWLNVKRILEESGGSKTNKEIVAEIHELYGNTNTSYACIAWYRNKWKKDSGNTISKMDQAIKNLAVLIANTLTEAPADADAWDDLEKDLNHDYFGQVIAIVKELKAPK